MTGRMLVVLGFVAALFPVQATAAGETVPVVPVGTAIGEAPRASLLQPSVFRGVFRVPRIDATLYVGAQWYVRDLTVTLMGPGDAQRTLTATTSLPGSMLGVRLPDDAWRADRIEVRATTVSATTPPYLLSGELLARVAWRSWIYAACFGLFLGLALMHGMLALTLRSPAFGWYTAVMTGNGALMLPWLGFVRPPPEVSQPLHAALQSVTFAGLALFSLAYMRRARVPRGVAVALWATVTLNVAAVVVSDVWQDVSPLSDSAMEPIVGAMALAFVALGIAGVRRHVDGAKYYLAGTIVAAAGLLIGTVSADVYNPVVRVAPQLGTAVQALLLGIALALQLRHREREPMIHGPVVRFDSLTGVASRAAVDERLRREWARSRTLGAPLAALMIDVDDFKRYNDAYGRPAGDEALRRIAGALARIASRSTDIVARFGDDVFLIVLSGTDLPAARRFGEAIVIEVRALAIKHDGVPTSCLTVSVGAAATVPGTEHESLLVARAGTALSIAKTMGRDRLIADEPLEDAYAASRQTGMTESTSSGVP